jgi:hypothetical protein
VPLLLLLPRHILLLHTRRSLLLLLMCRTLDDTQQAPLSLLLQPACMQSQLPLQQQLQQQRR